MKKFFIINLCLSIAMLFSSCHIGRFFVWNFADLNDYKKFQSIEVEKPSTAFTFFKNSSKDSLFLTNITYKNKNINLDVFNDDHKSVAFLVIKDDTILYEKYYRKYGEEAMITSFSIAKSIISALIGIAISDGFIKSENQPVTDYISWLKDEKFQKVTIKNLLNMRTGIDYKESYINPFGNMAKYYYGKNLKKYLSTLKINEEPGIEYNYVSVSTIILSQILEAATGMKTFTYLEQKIWQPLQMEFNASVSVDSKKHNTVKAYCCIDARARDFAKFGRLYLNKGEWNGKQIIPQEWIKKSTEYTGKADHDFSYQYHWRATTDKAFFAKGIMGQFIYVQPDKKVIIVRCGKSYADVDWIRLFESIASKI